MRVAHICFIFGVNNTGGAAIAATRLHNALLEAGEESYYICHFSHEKGTNVYALPRGRFLRFFHKFLGKVTRFMWHFTSYGHSLETNILPLFGLKGTLRSIKPDVVHVHWLNRGVVSFSQLGNLGYPTVMHLHDLFMMNILEPHPAKDRRYIEGLTEKNSQWWERWLFNRKKNAVSKLRPLIIGPSEWICECARNSIIGKGCQIQHVPNIIDKTFYTGDISFPEHKKFRILFGANGGRKSSYKGFPDLVEALKMFPDEVKQDCELWIFGEKAADVETEGVKTHFCGVIDKPEDLKKIYLASDVFALASRLDNAPSTKFEALLTGVPVVAFKRTGCAEEIVSGNNGVVAEDGDIKGFADGLLCFYQKYHAGAYADLRLSILRSARIKFSRDLSIDQIKKSYTLAKVNHS